MNELVELVGVTRCPECQAEVTVKAIARIARFGIPSHVRIIEQSGCMHMRGEIPSGGIGARHKREQREREEREKKERDDGGTDDGESQGTTAGSHSRPTSDSAVLAGGRSHPIGSGEDPTLRKR